MRHEAYRQGIRIPLLPEITSSGAVLEGLGRRSSEVGQMIKGDSKIVVTGWESYGCMDCRGVLQLISQGEGAIAAYELEHGPLAAESAWLTFVRHWEDSTLAEIHAGLDSLVLVLASCYCGTRVTMEVVG